MVSVTNFTFNNLTGIDNDNTIIGQSNIANTKFSSYTTADLLSNCNMNKTMDIATSQPYVFPNGAPYTNGCDIYHGLDVDMRLSKYENKFKSEIDLNQRPYVTVPYLGKGAVNAELEMKIQSGVSIVNKKTTNNLSENSDIDYTYTPMLPELQASIQNPENLIEGVASKGWVRSGIPTRFARATASSVSN